MTIATPVTHALGVFDGFRRGAPAPDWINRGVQAQWAGAGAVLAVELIAVSENATFKVAIDGVPALVVRVHRPGYVGSRASVESELLWIEALLRDTGVRTPRPVRGLDGALIQTIADDAGIRWSAVAFSFVTGTVLEDSAGDPAVYRRIGALTAVLHDHTTTWRRPAGFERFDWGLDELVGRSPRWGAWQNAVGSATELRTLKAAQRRAADVLSSTVGHADDRGLIHSDLRPSNIMIDGDELTVIDFDDCGHSWLLYDFAAALTFYEHRPEALEMAAQWLDGYRSARPLTGAELEQAAALSMVRRLTMLGWSTTHRSDALPPDLWEENLPGTVEVAARYLRDPMWLVDPS